MVLTMEAANIITAACFALVGLFVGTFATTCIERLPFVEEDFDEEDPPHWYYHIPFFSLFIALPRYTRFGLLLPAARCPACSKRLAWLERLPALSFLLQRGRCRHCQYKIPGRHLIVELATAILFAGAWFLSGWQYRLVVAVILIPLFVVASVVDWRFQIIPDEVNAFGLLAGTGLSIAWTLWYAYRHWSTGDPWRILNSPSAILWAFSGFMVGAGSLWLFHLLGSAYAGTDAMGFGDVKLAAFVGLFLGPLGTLVFLAWGMLLGAAAGVIVKLVGGGRMQGGYTAFAFGPYLCAGALVALFVGTNGPVGNSIQNVLATLHYLLFV